VITGMPRPYLVLIPVLNPRNTWLQVRVDAACYGTATLFRSTTFKNLKWLTKIVAAAGPKLYWVLLFSKNLLRSGFFFLQPLFVNGQLVKCAIREPRPQGAFFPGLSKCFLACNDFG